MVEELSDIGATGPRMLVSFRNSKEDDSVVRDCIIVDSGLKRYSNIRVGSLSGRSPIGSSYIELPCSDRVVLLETRMKLLSMIISNDVESRLLV